MWWRVWHRRNRFLHHKEVFPVSDIWDWANVFIDDFRVANFVETKKQLVVSPPPKWSPPHVGCFKINSDAATRDRDGRSGVGCVIRDSDGYVRASLCQGFDVCYPPQVAETLAILHGCRLAAELGLLPTVLESDALSVVEAVRLKSMPLSEVGVVIQDILEIFTSFPVFSICFVPRLANKVVHGLARLAVGHVGRFVWVNDCPLAVESLVLGDSQEPIKYDLVKAARFANILEAVTVSLVIIVSYMSDALFSNLKILTCSVFSTILSKPTILLQGLLLFTLNLKLWGNHESLYIIGILLLAVGEAGSRPLLKEFLGDQLKRHKLDTNTDNQDGVEAHVEVRSEDPIEHHVGNRVDSRAKEDPEEDDQVDDQVKAQKRVWLIFAWVSSVIATFVISNYSWEIIFISSTSLLSGTFILFLFGIYFYHSKEFHGDGSSLFNFIPVIKTSLLKWHLNYPSSPSHFFHNNGNQLHLSPQVKFLRWLDKAAIIESSTLLPEEQKHAGRLCTVTQVEDSKLLLKMIPMWTTFFVVGMVGMTGDTFSSEQGKNLDLTDFTFYIVFFLKPISQVTISIFYNKLLNSKRASKAQLKLGKIVRIWSGMVLSTIFCAVAWRVEVHRLQTVNLKRNMSIFWLAPQYCLLGLMQGTATDGLNEFMTGELPKSLKNYASAMNGFVVDGIGSFLSILYVHANRKLFSTTMNESRLDKYYFRLLILSFLNMCYYYPISTIYRPIHYL
ncbi:hypothetical protein EZV62_001058 [Acer yangbiense]|uniref:RNase H type-1 domain-containing protein n=1 Tax=Acer yangbiense TaxID=1000413 RepID=A0A5C7ITL2_9ROSI|nr:hypothetical protein EZV62_001058 [Acer yangbiense]